MKDKTKEKKNLNNICKGKLLFLVSIAMHQSILKCETVGGKIKWNLTLWAHGTAYILLLIEAILYSNSRRHYCSYHSNNKISSNNLVLGYNELIRYPSLTHFHSFKCLCFYTQNKLLKWILIINWIYLVRYASKWP